MTTQVPDEPAPLPRGRRAAPRTAATRYDTWRGIVWTIVVALDLCWISNPLVLTPWDHAVRYACIATGIGVLLTLPTTRLPRPAWTVLCVIILGFASVLWSINPDVSFDFTMAAVLVAAIATVVATYADARAVAHGMMLGGVAYLGASWYALEQNLPKAAVPPGTEGYLAGIGGNRNILAYTLVLCLAFATSFIPRRWWGRVLWALGGATILLGLYLSQSGTGLAATVIVLATAVALLVADRHGTVVLRSARRRWSVRAVAVGLLVGAVLAVDLLSRLLGRDIGSLSGRVPLWKAIWASTTGRERWIGNGWGAVWPHGWVAAPTSNPVFREIIGRTGSWLGHGHSAVFDLIPEIGLVGVAAFALVYLQAIVRALRLRDPVRASHPAVLQASRVTLLGILGLVVFGLTEPMSSLPIGWFVAVMLASGLLPGGRGLRRRTIGGRRRADPRRPLEAVVEPPVSSDP